MYICLNMIVKNEAGVIRRCLALVKRWVDHWMIIDTSAFDGRQMIAQPIVMATLATPLATAMATPRANAFSIRASMAFNSLSALGASSPQQSKLKAISC